MNIHNEKLILKKTVFYEIIKNICVLFEVLPLHIDTLF